MLNKEGIACAADRDHTIYRLHRDLPVILAVDPESAIPWNEIIEEYKKNMNTRQPPVIQQYAFEFETFLSGQDRWKDLPPTESEIMFLGYGQYEIFPSVYREKAVVDDSGVLGLKPDKESYRLVTYRDPVILEHLGDIESVAALLTGCTEENRRLIFRRQMALWKDFSETVMQKSKGAEYEEYVNAHLALPYDFLVKDAMKSADAKAQQGLTPGISSFGIEDMVTAVEAIVSANAKLNRLKRGERGKSGNVREIAVLTIPEGLTWIKHSLYMRRNEI